MNISVGNVIGGDSTTVRSKLSLASKQFGFDPDEILVSYHLSAADATNGVNAVPDQFSLVTGTETIYVRTTSSSNPSRAY